MKNAEIVGAHLMAGAKALMDKHTIIGDVRGRGLMIGIELVRDRQTKERATTERDAVVRGCFKRGLLVLGAGQNAIRLSPPLVLTKEQADTALAILDQALTGVRAETDPDSDPDWPGTCHRKRAWQTMPGNCWEKSAKISPAANLSAAGTQFLSAATARGLAKSTSSRGTAT